MNSVLEAHRPPIAAPEERENRRTGPRLASPLCACSSKAIPVPGVNTLAGFGDESGKVRRERGLARAIQNTLAPAVVYQDLLVEAYGRTIPREDAGGDLVDLVAVGGDIFACVADISGHGLSAAVLMGMVKTAVRYGLQLGQSLPELLAGLNRVLPAVKEPSMYATLAGLRFHGSNEAEYITAGHLPLLQYRRRQRDVVRCSITQFPMGLFEGVSYVSERVRFEAGDVFALATDGLVEVTGEGDVEFGFERLEEILCDLAGLPLSEMFDAALGAVARHGGQQDDQTLLLVRARASRQ